MEAQDRSKSQDSEEQRADPAPPPGAEARRVVVAEKSVDAVFQHGYRPWPELTEDFE